MLILNYLIITSYLFAFITSRTRKNIKHKTKDPTHKRDFIIGFAIGYGLSIDASDEIKNCFKDKGEKNVDFVEHFFNKVDHHRSIHKSQSKDKLEEGTKAFIKYARELFSEIKNCPPLRMSISSLIGSKIQSLAVKGVILFFQ